MDWGHSGPISEVLGMDLKHSGSNLGFWPWMKKNYQSFKRQLLIFKT